MFRRYQIRLLTFAIGMPIFLFCMGIAETGRCVRALLGPSTISYADACSKGLAGYGYVRVTGAHPAIDKSTIIVQQKRRGGVVVEKGWAGVYVPIEPAESAAEDGADPAAAPAAQPGGGYSVMAWLPEARNDEDVLELDDSTDLTGFVDSTFADVDPSHQGLVKYINRARADHCWIVKVRHPSWFRGIGLTLVSAIIPGLCLLWWRSRRSA